MTDHWEIQQGDCLELLRGMDAESVDACVTDPPYGLGFMGKKWDASVPELAVWAQVLRVLKPGAHLVAFGGTRTFHRLTCAIEDAGFEIRDSVGHLGLLGWVYGQGFPKSLDVSKSIDSRKDWRALRALQAEVRAARKRLGISQSEAARRCGLIPPDESLGGGGFMWFETGMRVPTREQWPSLKAALALTDALDGAFEAAEREVVGRHADGSGPGGFGDHRFTFNTRDITAPATEAARLWSGWGTALKPAWEPIILARKPLSGTVAASVLAHGTGALNVDGCRIAASDKTPAPVGRFIGSSIGTTGHTGERDGRADSLGRWPANVVLDEEAAAALDEQSGDLTRGKMLAGTQREGIGYRGGLGNQVRNDTHGDSGGASRFFYTAKASTAERQGAATERNLHPTVKPLELMRWLCRLVTPPGGLVLDPFVGSGTTVHAALLEGFRAIGMERDAEMAAFARRRIAGPLFAEDGP